MPRSLPVTAVVVALSVSLGACGSMAPNFLSWPPQVRGNNVDADQVKNLVPGTTTQKDVTSLLGSPTARATFDDNTWLYISEVTKPVIAGTQGVEDQHVVVLSFDDRGVLKSVDTKTQGDGLPVNVVSRTTPSPGNNASLWQQLLGNVGKFNAGPGGTGGLGNAGGNGGGNGGSPNAQ